MAIAVGLIAVGVAGLFAMSFAVAVLRRLSPVQRRRALGWLVSVGVALALGIALLRFGVHWFAAAGAAVASLGRRLLPLLRLLPAFHRMAGDARHSGGAWGPPGASGEARGPDPRRPSARQKMTRREALAVLGLEEGASAQDVRREYRRLMKRLHPDLGGSSYLAARVNEAKDVLLA